MESETSLSTWSFALEGQEACLVFENFRVSIHGASLVWQVRGWQDMLGLGGIGQEYYSKWITRSWPGWEQHCCHTLQLPGAFFLPSVKSFTARFPGSSPGCRQARTEFSLASPALVGVLARWCDCLKEAQAKQAGKLLRGLVDTVLGTCEEAVWYASLEAGPAHEPRQPFQQGAVPVNVVRGYMQLTPFGREGKLLEQGLQTSDTWVRQLEVACGRSDPCPAKAGWPGVLGIAVFLALLVWVVLGGTGREAEHGW